MASASCYSLGRSSTLLRVELKSATLNFKRAGNFYIRVWINQEQKLETKVVSWIIVYDPPVWNPKFIFSVPNTFISDENSTVHFEILQERKYFPDFLVGRAECKVKSLSPVENMELRNGIEEEVKYDTENDLDDDDDEIQEGCVAVSGVGDCNWTQFATLYVEYWGSLEVSKGSSKKGCLDIEMVVWSSDVSGLGDCNWLYD
ncbi:unnamed protein product [Ilex paraguariensis]|uniref:C2 domain-containing protein n=1 Tax=Ilex paraguariensis TaxID=185542 RepID=A0ABC8SLJ3_9AQUA